MGSQYRVTLRSKSLGLVTHQTCSDDDQLEVRELTTRACVTIRPGELSPYRHTLLRNGEEFQIMNVVRC